MSQPSQLRYISPRILSWIGWQGTSSQQIGSFLSWRYASERSGNNGLGRSPFSNGFGMLTVEDIWITNLKSSVNSFNPWTLKTCDNAPVVGFFCVIVWTDEQVFRLICQGKRLGDLLNCGSSFFLSQSVHYCPLVSTSNGHDYGISKAYYEQSVHLSTYFSKRGVLKNIYIVLYKSFFCGLVDRIAKRGFVQKLFMSNTNGHKWTQVD
jgi:hypothetical protein